MSSGVILGTNLLAVSLFPSFHLYRNVFHTFTPETVRLAIRSFFEHASLTGVVAEGVVYARTSLVTLSGPHSFSFGGVTLLHSGCVPDSAASMEGMKRE